MTLRLDKLLADAGWGSRSETRRAIRAGRVTVDGAAVLDPSVHVDADRQTVTVDGQDAGYRAHDYLMLHKPAGVVSATEDPTEPTVISLLPPRYQRRGLFPAGRLDKDATGLLLLTNDGALCHAMTAPGRGIARVYQVLLDKPVGSEDISAFTRGLMLPDGESCLPAALTIDSDRSREAGVTIYEGKYHQIKRMFAARGLRVISLKRLSHGPLLLDEDLPPGAWRPLDETELRMLLDVCFLL